MARASRTRYPVLGALTRAPMHGYEIKKFMEGSISNFWRESYGQLYPTLRRLTEEGLVERRDEVQEGRPDRYRYSITPAGREAFEAWLREPAVNEVPRSELALKIFFGSQISAADCLRHVRERRTLLEANLARLSGLAETLRAEHGSAPGLPYWLLTLRLGELLDRAQLAWCEEAEHELERKASEH